VGNERDAKEEKSLDKGKEARRLARSAAAAPAATKVVPDKRKKPEKHRKKWREEGNRRSLERGYSAGGCVSFRCSSWQERGFFPRE